MEDIKRYQKIKDWKVKERKETNFYQRRSRMPRKRILLHIINLYIIGWKDELSHRGIKDFGTEHLPFRRFEPNSVFYYTTLISFFLFETFKEDVLKGMDKQIEVSVNEKSYATTFRRYLIDFEAKIVHTGREIILKVTGIMGENKEPKTLGEM